MQPTRAFTSLAELAAGKPIMLIKGNSLICEMARGTTSIKAVEDRCNMATAYCISVGAKPALRNLSVMYSLATCSHAIDRSEDSQFSKSFEANQVFTCPRISALTAQASDEQPCRCPPSLLNCRWELGSCSLMVHRVLYSNALFTDGEKPVKLPTSLRRSIAVTAAIKRSIYNHVCN